MMLSFARVLTYLLWGMLMLAMVLTSLPQNAVDLYKPPPSILPHWQASYATRFPGCTARLPKGVLVARQVLLMTDDRVIHRMDFNKAWRLCHKIPAYGWVVGVCK